MDNNNNTLKIAQKLYFQQDETSLDHLFTRVARAASIAERVWNQDPYIEKITFEKFYESLSNFEIVPNTPAFANANPVTAERMVEYSKGNLKYEDFTDEDKHSLLSACFVLPLEDSLDSIMDMNSLAAKLHKLKAGTGFCFSRLRPEKWPIKYHGNNIVEAYKENLKLADNAKLCSSGPVSFLEHVFDSTTSAIKEGGGRRGANMCTFHVSHPDIFKLLDAKNDLNRITNFNLSILIPNAFIDAVKDDLDWDLVWKEQIVDTVKARSIWNKIVHQAWKTGEPGLLFVDTANQQNPLVPILGNMDATNPCVTGDTLILTSNGYIEIEKCVGKQVNIWNGFEWSEVEPKITGYDKDIYEVTLSSGQSLKCTGNHNFIVQDLSGKTNRVATVNLEVGMRLAKFDFTDVNSEELKVESIRTIGKANKVYCFTEPKRHLGCFNGIITGNCGEVYHYNFGACSLSAINLKTCLTETPAGWELNWHKLEHLSRLNLRFLDNLIEINCFPDKRLFEENKKFRAAGSGLMGLAETLAYLMLPYDSQVARDFVDEVFSFIHKVQAEESIELAKVRGVYPYGELVGDKRRNWTCSVVAPNGSSGIFANTNGGIEPFYGLSLYHATADLTVVQDSVKQIGLKQGWWSQEVEESVVKEGSLTKTSLDEKIKEVFKIANEIGPLDHVRMLGTCATHIDNSVSKSINMANTATEQEVEEAFMLAFELGCKGITVYRDGCRANVLNVGKAKKDCECGPFEKRDAIKRPRSLDCEIHHVSVKGEKWVVIVGLLEKSPYEVFVGYDDKVDFPKAARTGTMTKKGRGNYILASEDKSVEVKSFQNNDSENTLTRIISTALRHGTHVRFIVDQLEKTEENVNSFSKAIGRVLKKYLKDGEPVTGMFCPDCGKIPVRMSGCLNCISCGWSRCG